MAPEAPYATRPSPALAGTIPSWFPNTRSRELTPKRESGQRDRVIATVHLNNRGQVGFEATVGEFGVNAQELRVWTVSRLEELAFEGEWFDVNPIPGVDMREIAPPLVTSRGVGTTRAAREHSMTPAF
ncbi:MAG: hypothetical protein Q7R30_19315 [Acidobacteriota bacterium]|nr:hypothetical protein [Acidobacteriota bacterium]